MIINKALSYKHLRLVEVLETGGFKMCLDRMTVSHPLVAIPLLTSKSV